MKIIVQAHCLMYRRTLRIGELQRTHGINTLLLVMTDHIPVLNTLKIQGKHAAKHPRNLLHYQIFEYSNSFMESSDVMRRDFQKLLIVKEKLAKYCLQHSYLLTLVSQKQHVDF